MTIQNFERVFPFLLKSRITPILWGQSGIGKTQVIRSLAKKHNYNFIYLTFGAVEDVGDIIGLQDFVVENGKNVATKHLRPEWFPTTPGNIILIDEFNRAPKSVVQAMLPFILDGRLHTHELPEDTHIIAAANPPTDEFIVGDISDDALMKRLCHLNLEPTVDEFLNFASYNDADYRMTSFIQENKEMLEVQANPFDLSFLKPSRRAYFDFVSPFIKQNPPEDLVFEVVRGIIGTQAASRFVSHIKNHTFRLKGKDIVNNYDSLARNAVRTHFYNRLDLLSNAADDLIREISKTKEIDEKQGTNIVSFLLDIPIELSYSYSRKILSLGREDLNRKIGDNKDLVSKLEMKVNEIKSIK
jgi:alkaline phosphatase D